MNISVLRLVGLVACTQTAWAQAPAVTDEAYLKAALVVKTFDHFPAACKKRRGFNVAESGAIDTWQRTNGVEHIRARLPELERFPAQQLQVDQAAATMVKLAAARGAKDCAAALSLTRAAEAQFAKVAPQLLAALPAGVAAAANTSAPAAEPPRTGAPPTAAPTVAAQQSLPAPDAVLAHIDSFAFNTRMTMGVSGFLSTDTYPIVLFRNGDVLTRVEALNCRSQKRQTR